ncbi:MAG: TrkA family potassium uptake protein [Halobacteriales archaeon]
MDNWKRRGIGYFVFIGLALFVTAIGYQWGMRVFEGRPRTFLESLQFAAEMFTTTGFGGDAPWQSPEMNLFITVTDLLGMAILVGALPVLVGPLLENALSSSAPQRLDSELADHVIITSYTPRAEELIQELDSHDVPYLIVERDRESADELYEAGHRVIRADPESTDGLEAAQLASARALYVDAADEIDASIVLAAKELTTEVPVISVVEEPGRERYHELAGADHVLSPRALLGESLARKVTTATRAEIDEAVAIDGELRLAEVAIRHGNPLAGATLADSGIRETTGVNVIGAWIRGEFRPAPRPDMELRGGSVLLVSGQADQLDQLVEMTQSPVRKFQAGETVIVGYGQVGQAVAGELEAAGIPFTVLDKADFPDVDVVGDGTEREPLIEAGVETAETVVLALPDDTLTEFATLVIRDLAPETEILGRVEEKSNVSKTYRAGADYVLSLATVTGRLTASHLLEERDVLSVVQQVEIVREAVPNLVGRTLAEADIRDQTGCTVLAIERGDGVVTNVGPETRIEAGDDLVLVGTDQGIRDFEQTFRAE